jgi:serine/threonine protein kinase
MVSDDKIYMVMELVSGGELFDQVVADGPMNEPQARRILHELMSALDCAHKQGIFHRDLKVPPLLLRHDSNPATAAGLCSAAVDLEKLMKVLPFPAVTDVGGLTVSQRTS